MSKADEMFKEIGFEKSNREYAEVFIAKRIEKGQIGFNMQNQVVFPDINYITMEELQAINEKVKELGWLDE